MLILNGANLGERQKQLNLKVNEASLNNVDFNEIKDKPEQSDIDKLFKIDLASKYMNIEYIIEVLKSGDSLYISRALKCPWMYDDEFSNIINVNYLHHNIFPYMSLKMKNKFLTTISVYVRNPDRALAFYKYCMESKLINIALKFVIFTSDDFKLKFLKNNPIELHELRYKNEFTHFIGSSFTLADAHLATQKMDTCKAKVLNEISYLYSVSDVKYLDMLEKRLNLSSCFKSYNTTTRSNVCLGLRISKDILTKHKDRVLKLPILYINFLNKSAIVKYSTADNAKIYVIELLPKEVDEFWSGNFCQYYEHILNILPAEDRFEFIKKSFNDKYPGQAFEMSTQFYKYQYYKFMTVEQKEQWALAQIASQKEILGIGKDFIWYKFINFEKGFEELKKLIMITHDNNRRSEIINILVESAKTQRDLEKLFKYYYDRHNNEQRHTKENFIDWATYNHNVYAFDKDCWAAFNKIFQNLEVYSMLDYNNCKSELKIIALIYHIVNKIDVHDALKLYISTNMYFYTLKLNTDKLSKEQQEMVFEYLFNFYMEKIYEFDSVPYDDEIKYKLRKYIYFVLDLLQQYDRTKNDIPKVVTKLMKLDWDEFKCHKLHHEQPKKTSQEDLIRMLKKDAKVVVESLPLVKKNIEISYRFNIGQFLKKLKVYFSHDISKDYIKFYNELLSDSNLYPKVAQAAAFGIFQLADNDFKVDFMKMYAPTQNKINRTEIKESLLNIQQAICATAFYSRPPVPLENMLMYLKGDYVPSCLPLFNSYLANLPLPLCMNFVEAILNTPLSIQKHGLRLAFVCFNAENLRKLVLYIWKKTKNVSLRLIIYKALYNKIVTEDQNAQTALFETLNALTLELHQDDDKELFELLTSGKLPRHLISDYTSAVWAAVSTLPKNNQNFQRMCAVVKYMCNHIRSIRQDIIRPIVQEFIQSEFASEDVEITDDASRLIRCKWTLAVNHITYVHNKDDLEGKLELTKHILNECLSKYNLVRNNEYVIRRVCKYFIYNILSRKYLDHLEDNDYINSIVETLLHTLETSFAIEDVYITIWDIKIYLAVRKVLVETKIRLPSLEDEVEKTVTLRDIVLNFGKDIGNLIKESVLKEMYFSAFQYQIEDKVRNEIKSMAYLIEYDINETDLFVLTSLALMEFKMTETYLFVLNIVPSDYSRQYEEAYKSVLNEIKELNNIEIKCKMYNKFINTDFKPRAFLQL